MTISYQWLCTYLPLKPSPDELAKILTSVGLEVEHYEKTEAIRGGLEGLVVGKVLSCEPHPGADKLKLTTVDLGKSTTAQIVCGAPNVAAGQTVIVAPTGTTIYPISGEPITLKKSKIRGIDSEGMICAEDEIGVGNSHEGIIVLAAPFDAGTPARDVYQLPEADYQYEIGLTPNRMEAMSHLGVARDVCAYLSHHQQTTYPLVKPEIAVHYPDSPCPIQVEIRDKERCLRYSGIVLDQIQVTDSPKWLQTRLQSIGLKPVNNIVDITNFVLHECGQPLHAFDLQAITGQKIVIDTAREGMKFTALDAKEYALSNQDLMIHNQEEPMCMAGVYGGLQSGVQPHTQAIFLESAWFHPQSVRKTALRHGLRTDAAIRFEKGADIDMTLYALERAVSLICDIAGARIVSSVLDVYPSPQDPRTIRISCQRINDLAGKIYQQKDICNILQSLNFKIHSTIGDEFEVQIPSSKPDISELADVVEEIMRIDGLDEIPFTGKIEFTLPETKSAWQPNRKEALANQLAGMGWQEMFTNSITNAAFYPDQEKLVTMINNLSADLNCLRPSMLESGLQAIAWNLNRKNLQIRFFEWGKVYFKEGSGYQESEKLVLFASGTYRSQHWSEKLKPLDLYYLKGVVQQVLHRLQPEWQAEGDRMQILVHRKPVGYLTSVNAAKRKQFDIRADVWYVEINWTEVASLLAKSKTVMKPLPRFPEVQRDISMILDRNTAYESVQKAVRQAKCDYLKSVDLFDVFESEKLGADKKSYAINLSFYHPDRTLTDADVESDMQKITRKLEQETGASIRQ